MADPTNPNPVADPQDAGFIEGTLPDPKSDVQLGPGRFRDIDPYEDVVLTTTPPDPEPPDLAGKSKEDLYKELLAQKAAIEAERAKNDPAKTIAETLQGLLGAQKPKDPEVTPGYLQQPTVGPQGPQETPEARKARLNDLFLTDPAKAMEEVQNARDMALAGIVATNQAKLSRELLMANPATKALYDRYPAEVEAEVARMTPVERFQDPRMYQTAVERVKLRHQDELMNEQLQAKVAELVKAGIEAELKARNIDPGTSAGAPVRPVPTVVGAGAPKPAATPKQGLYVPPAIAAEAFKIGVDPKFYYQHLVESGRIKP